MWPFWTHRLPTSLLLGGNDLRFPSPTVICWGVSLQNRWWLWRFYQFHCNNLLLARRLCLGLAELTWNRNLRPKRIQITNTQHLKIVRNEMKLEVVKKNENWKFEVSCSGWTQALWQVNKCTWGAKSDIWISAFTSRRHKTPKWMRWMQQIRLLLVAVWQWLPFKKTNIDCSFSRSWIEGLLSGRAFFSTKCINAPAVLCTYWVFSLPRLISAISQGQFGKSFLWHLLSCLLLCKIQIYQTKCHGHVNMSTHHNSWPAGMLKMTNTWLCKLWRMQTREVYSRISKPHKGTTLNETMRGGNACGTRKPSFEKISHHSSSPPPNHPPPPSPPSPPSSPPPNHPPLESLDPPLSPYQLSPPPRPLSGEDPGGGGEASPPGAAPPSSFLCTTSICLGPRIPSIMRDATEVPTPHARPSINAPRNPPPMPPTAGAPASGGGCTAEGFGAPNAVVWFVCLFHQ